VIRDSQEEPGADDGHRDVAAFGGDGLHDVAARDVDRSPVVPAGRLGELVAHLTGEDQRDSAEAAAQRLGPARSADDPLAVVARAIVDLRDSRHSLRVTRYVNHLMEVPASERPSR